MPAVIRFPTGARTSRFRSTSSPRSQLPFSAAAWFTGLTIWLALGVAAAGFAYYNFPLLETGRPTMGANQYGIFVQAFGLIRWRAIDKIDLISIAERDTTIHEIQIGLKVPLSSALVADWRKQPVYRSLMRLPWSMTPTNVVRIRLGRSTSRRTKSIAPCCACGATTGADGTGISRETLLARSWPAPAF